MEDKDSNLWYLKGTQPLIQFCGVQCQEDSNKDYFMPPSQYHIYQQGCLFSTLELLRLRLRADLLHQK